MSLEDFGDMDQATFDKLRDVQVRGKLVTVDCEACDGYYDVTLPDGTQIEALSAYHLVGY